MCPQTTKIYSRFHPFETNFNSVQDKNVCLAASDLIHLCAQSIKLYTFHYRVLKNTDARKW